MARRTSTILCSWSNK